MYKREGDPPAVVDPPEELKAYFEERKKRLAEVVEKGVLWEVLHVATLTQEAALLLAIASMRFKNTTVAKQYKFGPVRVSSSPLFRQHFLSPSQLVAHLKSLVNTAQSTLKEMSTSINQLGSVAGSAERRKEFVESCKPIQVFADQVCSLSSSSP